MGRAWILDTETKGTGAHVAPLEKSGRSARERELATVRLARPPRPTEAPERRLPRQFKVLDVMSGRVLAEGVGAPAVVELLEGARSFIDLRVYAWAPKSQRWRLLTLDEQRELWRFRGEQRSGSATERTNRAERRSNRAKRRSKGAKRRSNRATRRPRG